MKPIGHPWLITPNEDDPSTWRLAENIEVCLEGVWKRASGIGEIKNHPITPKQWHFEIFLEDGTRAQIDIVVDRPNTNVVRVVNP